MKPSDPGNWAFSKPALVPLENWSKGQEQVSQYRQQCNHMPSKLPDRDEDDF